MGSQMHRNKQKIITKNVDFFGPSLNQTIARGLELFKEEGIEGVTVGQLFVLFTPCHNQVEVEIYYLNERSLTHAPEEYIALLYSLRRSAKKDLEASQCRYA